MPSFKWAGKDGQVASLFQWLYNQYPDTPSHILSGRLKAISANIKFLNTITGTPVTGAANMIDVSGNAHNGTYTGTWAANQRVAKGFGFVLSPNGTDNYITLGDSNDFSFGDGANDIAVTIAGLIEVVDTGANQTIIAKRIDTIGAELREWMLYLTNTKALRFMLIDESSNAAPYRTSNAALSAGVHSYVITYSGVGGVTAANGIVVYIDGVVVASTATNDVAYVAMENTTAPVTLLSRIGGAGTYTEFMTGDFTPPIIDKGTVWTAAQVTQFHDLMRLVYGL